MAEKEEKMWQEMIKEIKARMDIMETDWGWIKANMERKGKAIQKRMDKIEEEWLDSKKVEASKMQMNECRQCKGKKPSKIVCVSGMKERITEKKQNFDGGNSEVEDEENRESSEIESETELQTEKAKKEEEEWKWEKRRREAAKKKLIVKCVKMSGWKAEIEVETKVKLACKGRVRIVRADVKKEAERGAIILICLENEKDKDIVLENIAELTKEGWQVHEYETFIQRRTKVMMMRKRDELSSEERWTKIGTSWRSDKEVWVLNELDGKWKQKILERGERK